MRLQLSLCALFIGVFFSLGSLSAQITCAQATLITNGNFDGSIGEGVTASGWTSTSTPDLNDHLNPVQTTPSYNWTGTPLESFDGGTWQNMFGQETISQSIECIIGNWYELKYHYAAQGISASGTDLVGPVGVLVSFNGVQEFFSPNDVSQYTWENESYIFQATESTIDITFQASTDQYLAIDGVCVYQTSEPTGINDETAQPLLSISAFPNPATTSVTLMGMPLQNARIELLDANGKLVFTENSNGDGQKIIPTNYLDSGLYLLRITLNEHIWTERIVIH